MFHMSSTHYFSRKGGSWEWEDIFFHIILYSYTFLPFNKEYPQLHLSPSLSLWVLSLHFYLVLIFSFHEFFTWNFHWQIWNLKMVFRWMVLGGFQSSRQKVINNSAFTSYPALYINVTSGNWWITLNVKLMQGV